MDSLFSTVKGKKDLSMAQKIYVGNLNYATTEEGLSTLFGTYGEVVSAVVIKDKFSNRSKGFGFVEMADEGAAQNAIAELNEKEFEGRRLRVNIAQEKPAVPTPNRFTHRTKSISKISVFRAFI